MRATFLFPSSLLALLIPSTLGDVVFTSPAPGASVPGGTTFTVTWKDSGVAPAITDLLTYQLFLFTGANAAPFQLYDLKAAVTSFSLGNSATVTVPVGIGGPGTNVYFIGMLSTAKAGGTITNFSDRFTLAGMTGTFPPAVVAANQNVVGTTGPPKINQVALAPAPAPVAGAVPGQDPLGWGTPYNLQTGVVRYAPMQPIPPTKITKVDVNPLWPTSSVPIATTFLPIAPIPTTYTQAQTFSAASHANTAAPQSHPVDDMQKFLNRWKD